MPPKIRSLSIEQLQAAVAELRRRYPTWQPGIPTRDVLSACIEEFGGLFCGQTSINNEPRKFFFFRSRTGDSLGDGTWTDPGQFSNPLPQFCLHPGRAHIPGHPVFYGTDSFDGAIMEVKRSDLTDYCVSIWHTNEVSLERLNFCYASNIRASRLLEQRDRAVKDMRKQYPDHNDLSKERMEALMAAWSDLFISDSYGLTASIAHQCMYGPYRHQDVLVYGSALDGSYVNYAIHPRFADTLTLHKVLAIRIGDQRGYEVRSCAESVDGRLVWRDPIERDLPEKDPFLPTTIE